MITSLQVEDGRISALITDMEGNFSMMVQTVNGIRTTVQNQAGQISQVEQTAARIATRVSNAEGDISAIEQTASSIQTSVRNLQGDISVIEQQADKIDWIVASGTSASRFTLTSRMAELISDKRGQHYNGGDFGGVYPPWRIYGRIPDRCKQYCGRTHRLRYRGRREREHQRYQDGFTERLQLFHCDKQRDTNDI